MRERESINLSIEQARPLCTEHKISMEYLCIFLEGVLSEHNVSICYQNDDDLLPGQIIITGEYGGDEYENEIEILLSRNFKHNMKLTVEEFDEFKFQLTITILHELIHKYQDDMRGDVWMIGMAAKMENGYETYLSQPDEIYARAHDIYMELDRTGSWEWNDLESSSETYDYYLETFGDKNHPVMKSLLKKVYQYTTGE